MTTLTGRAVLVTGAAKRVGRVIAVAAARAGAPLALHYRGSARDAAETRSACLTAGSPRVSLHQADLSSPDAAAQLVEAAWHEHGFLWGLVNNASAFFPTPEGTAEADHWAALMDVNARAPWQTAVALAVRATAEAREARIVNLVDVAARKAWASYPAYGASKAALAWITRSQAKAWAKHGITVNAVSPAATLFPDAMDETERAAILRRIPSGAAQPPEDVAAAVMFFLTAPASITGQDLAVDGGSLLS